ncbi:hypothetical protein ACJ72_01582 [Emergomyces africanus]|uniref:Uncharacterized protein n=1 Tax=Emergomyces africanus TaxID=1955775 RepID=A0A1B7P592_9EURO|nr:hypothetical protein ACJ72_01582 [Emergomyces africanus]
MAISTRCQAPEFSTYMIWGKATLSRDIMKAREFVAKAQIRAGFLGLAVGVSLHQVTRQALGLPWADEAVSGIVSEHDPLEPEDLEPLLKLSLLKGSKDGFRSFATPEECFSTRNSIREKETGN